MDREEFMEKYHNEHYFCPECHCKGYSVTLVGYMYDENHPEEYKDNNRVRCQICGWKGTVHTLAPKTPKTIFHVGYTENMSDGRINLIPGSTEDKEFAKHCAEGYNNDQKVCGYRYYMPIEEAVFE